MSAYLQQGHGSWGLLQEPEIGGYRGLILSPVNDGPDAVRSGLARLGDTRGSLEVILDPQLYNPSTDKGQLTEWSYFPADFSTADQGDRAWWAGRGRAIVDAARAIEANAICSPALLARHFSDDYYRLIVDVADSTFAYANEHGIDTLMTAIIYMRDLGNLERAQQIASILSSSDCDRVYLTFLVEDLDARQPFSDAAALAGAIHLVRLLGRSLRVHVACCGHDLVLWKAAGAQDVSSGKFFNLRRFSPARWRENEMGGRQVSYWNEAPLLTYLRDQEVLRLDREGWFASRSFQVNPYSEQILATLRAGTGAAWQKLSWLQYLRWVANSDSRYVDPGLVERDLREMDQRWGEVNDELRILLTDRFNNGSHVRWWINALSEGLGRR